MEFKDLLYRWEQTPKGKKLTEKHLQDVYTRDDIPKDGSSALTVSELRRMAPQAELDLHGMTSNEAETAVMTFLKESAAQGLLKVRVVHGKGNHSEKGESVLGGVVKTCIERSPYAGMSGTPPAGEGGSGAVWIAVKRAGKKQTYRSR